MVTSTYRHAQVADSDDRRRLTASPATEKTLSDGAELAGTDIYLLARYPSLQGTDHL